MSTEPNITGIIVTLRQVEGLIKTTPVLMDYQAVQAEMQATAGRLDALYRAVKISDLHLRREDATSTIRDVDHELQGTWGLRGNDIAVDWC